MDLADDATRARVTAALGTLYAGRRVLLPPIPLAGATRTVAWLRELGCEVLVLATTRGAGPVPDPGECVVVELAEPSFESPTEELRRLDRTTRGLPREVVAAIDAFDPDHRGVWRGSPFLTSDEPIDGRVVLGGRPAAFVALEDKLVAEQVWAACGVPTAPHRVVPVQRAPLLEATEALSGPLGAVWSGDARDGFNGGADFVRWVTDEASADAALAFFAERCDHVRVMPFLDGVPCSIHGMVLPDGTAAFRPVEIAMLRDPAATTFVYGGLSTFWDPPVADRAEMRSVAKRVGAHLAAAHGYRGAFGVDGVLTADGFRPTELNPRFSAGFTALATVAPELLQLLQDNLLAGRTTGVTVPDVESLVPLMDAERSGRPHVIVPDGSLAEPVELPVTWDGRALRRTAVDTGSVVVAAGTPVGVFAKVDPCAALRPGERLAPLNAALMRLLDHELGTRLPEVEVAPDLRVGPRHADSARARGDDPPR